MKTLFFCAMALVATDAAADRPQLAVTTIEGNRLRLRGVSAELDPSGIEVSGWVRRSMANYGPISSHLHVEALSADGQTLRTLEARWQGELPSLVRYRRSALFRVTLPTDSATASIRVSVVSGPRHSSS